MIWSLKDMDDWKDTPNHVPWPPILYLGTAMTTWLIHQYAAPLPWPTGAAQAALSMLGVFLIALGVAIEIATVLTFRKNKTTVLPHRVATNLITTGPFKYSRNPIYLANTMLLAGAGLVFGIAWFIAGAVVAALLTHHLAIRREEQHLAAKFGDAWTAYTDRTPRWILV
jgi:protein-S-isoprenylcysteine O-methyltransferase Ste14